MNRYEYMKLPPTASMIDRKSVVTSDSHNANEIFRLAQGVVTRMPSGTNTILFIPKEKVPSGRTVTYGRIVAEIIPQKAETHCT